MRRQVPCVSPNCTRELGPIDATMRDCLLAPARTMTQSRETDDTQRALRRDFAAVVGAVKDVPAAGPGIAIAVDCGTTTGASDVGATSPDCADVVLPLPAGLTDGDVFSAAFAMLRASAVSAGISTGFPGDVGVRGAAASCRARSITGDTSSFDRLRRTKAVPTIITSAVEPAAFQISGVIGGCSGLVPHHLHSPSFSG